MALTPHVDKKTTPSKPRRSRAYKAADGGRLEFTETADGGGYDVTVTTATGKKAKVWISKGEGRSFARFLQIRRK